MMEVRPDAENGFDDVGRSCGEVLYIASCEAMNEYGMLRMNRKKIQPSTT
jgi:hypothetical protein